MISKNKQYRTRDGREVRIYETDGGGEYPVHGAVKVNDIWQPKTWKNNGLFDEEKEVICDHDLIEIRPRIKREYWVNVYPSESATRTVFETKIDANEHSAAARIACVKVVIDCEEGEGL